MQLTDAPGSDASTSRSVAAAEPAADVAWTEAAVVVEASVSTAPVMMTAITA